MKYQQLDMNTKRLVITSDMTSYQLIEQVVLEQAELLRLAPVFGTIDDVIHLPNDAETTAFRGKNIP